MTLNRVLLLPGLTDTVIHYLQNDLDHSRIECIRKEWRIPEMELNDDEIELACDLITELSNYLKRYQDDSTMLICILATLTRVICPSYIAGARLSVSLAPTVMSTCVETLILLLRRHDPSIHPQICDILQSLIPLGPDMVEWKRSDVAQRNGKFVNQMLNLDVDVAAVPESGEHTIISTDEGCAWDRRSLLAARQLVFGFIGVVLNQEDELDGPHMLRLLVSLGKIRKLLDHQSWRSVEASIDDE